MIDKQQIVRLIQQHLQQELQVIQQSAAAASSGAKHEDAIAKSKYDTHGLELSYLAGAQAERARLIRGQIRALQALTFSQGDFVAVGSLVRTDCPSDSQHYYFLCQQGAGVKLEQNGCAITVISPESPIGGQLLDASVGDEVVIRGTERQILEVI